MTTEQPFSGMISIERPYQVKGAPSCGIYLVSPVKLKINLFAQQMRAAFMALNESPYEKHMHAMELRFPKAVYDKERADAAALVAICRRNGVVPIVRGDVGLCIECGADGVILDNPKEVAEARRILGEQAIIGVDCGNDKKKAEAALKAGVDYVSLSRFFAKKDAKGYADISLLEWWSTKTHLPAVATGSVGGTGAIRMAQAGAGFIGGGAWVWSYAKGPKQAIYWLQQCIEHGLLHQRVN